MLVRSSLAAAFVLAATVLPASALDQPISGAKIVLKTGKLQFLSKDPAFLFPSPGGADDPTTQGATVELFSESGMIFSIAIPAGVATPGWSPPEPDEYGFVNKDAPDGPSMMRSVSMRQANRLKIVGRNIGPFVNGPLVNVGLRITTGSLRSCALFNEATVRKDVAGAFVARNATAAALGDCSDGALFDRPCEEAQAPSCGGVCPPDEQCVQDGSACTCEPLTCGSSSAPACAGTCAPGETCLSVDGVTCACEVACSDTTFPPCDGACAAGSECGTQDLSTCMCISGAQPCGDTSPTCNGECPVGDECMPIGGFPLPSCGCLPAGSNSCQHAVCNGDCPAGSECNYFEVSFPGASGCSCGPPGACGTGGDDCPAGFHCAFLEPSGFFCAPN